MPPEENPADNEQMTEEESTEWEATGPVQITEPLEQPDKPLTEEMIDDVYPPDELADPQDEMASPSPAEHAAEIIEQVAEAYPVPEDILEADPKSNFTGTEGFRMPGKPSE